MLPRVDCQIVSAHFSAARRGVPQISSLLPAAFAQSVRLLFNMSWNLLIRSERSPQRREHALDPEQSSDLRQLKADTDYFAIFPVDALALRSMSKTQLIAERLSLELHADLKNSIDIPRGRR